MLIVMLCEIVAPGPVIGIDTLICYELARWRQGRISICRSGPAAASQPPPQPPALQGISIKAVDPVSTVCISKHRLNGLIGHHGDEPDTSEQYDVAQLCGELPLRRCAHFDRHC